MVAQLLVTHAATAVCCCCRRESACRYDCLWFLVVIMMFRYEEVSAVVDDPLILPSVKIEPPTRKPSMTGAATSVVLPQFVYDTRIDPKMRARMIENEMNEQAKLVQDLYQLRASRNTIEMEERKLHDLQVYLQFM